MSPLLLRTLGCLLAVAPLMAFLQAEDTSPTQALLADRSVQSLAFPPRSHGSFQTQLIVEREDGVEMRRTRLSGPITILLTNFDDWVPARRPNPAFGLHLVRFANEDISLGVSWIRKSSPELLPGPAIWGYARHLIENADRNTRVELKSNYPPEPNPRPLNVLGRNPAILDFERTDLENQITTSVRWILLDFENTFLVFTLETPPALFQANSRQVMGSLAYAHIVRD